MTTEFLMQEVEGAEGEVKEEGAEKEEEKEESEE